jgi:prepilin-type N-terminal cleavage/methylation domain-containing protein
MPHSRIELRRAFTLLELLVVLSIVGLTAIVALRQLQRQLDRIAARNAVAEAATLVARARDEAVAQHTPVSLRVDTVAATLELRARGERLATYPLGGTHGVRLATTRDSITFDVRGLGYGAANLTLAVRRGAASETLVVSRLGRARY